MPKILKFFLVMAMITGLLYIKTKEVENKIPVADGDYKAEISTGLALVTLKNYKPTIHKPKPGCECNGTGYIVHGDGHKTECRCGPSCQCKPTYNRVILE